MKTYNAKLRLSGSVLNEVEKFGLTYPEIMLLRQDPKDLGHGPDALINIREAGEATMPDPNAEEPAKAKPIARTDEYERSRLVRLYGPARIEKMFGPEHAPLPQNPPASLASQISKSDDLGAMIA